jgi:hypothetical protein
MIWWCQKNHNPKFKEVKAHITLQQPAARLCFFRGASAALNLLARGKIC